MPRLRRTWRIARDEYALSAMTAWGLRRGRPAPVRGALSVHDRVEDGGIVHVAGCDYNGQGQAPAVAGEMDFRGQPAAGPAQRLASRRVCRIFQFVPRCRPFFRAPAAC